MEPNFEDLFKIANTKMPYGKYSGWVLIDLPEPYVVWMYNKGLPDTEIGKLLKQLYDIKTNGLEYLFTPLKGRSL